MIKKVVFIVVLTLIFSSIFSLEIHEKYFKFSINSKNELEKLTGIISIDNVIGNEVFAYANQSEFEEFQKLGYLYEILPNPSTLIIPEMASSPDQMRDWDYYPTYEAYIDMMYQFETDYPDLCIIQNIGYSVNGREIIFAKISDNVNQEEDEPEFMYTSTMHGNETTGYVLMLHLIDYLLTNYGIDDRVTNIVDNIEVWINPLANPDGTYTGGNNVIVNPTRYNANGVDLNRNFPDPEDGQHPDGNPWQVETIAMMDLAYAHSFVLSSNIHGGAEVINYPWDTWAQLHADDDWWQEVSHTYANAAQANSPYGYMNGFNNGITNGYAWYTINGGRQDYMNYFHGCREMTLEISNVGFLPASQLPAHWDYNKESFLLYLEECLYGIRGVVTDSYGQPIEALITVYDDTGQLHDFDNSEVFTDPDVGDYHRMIAPGNYDIEVSAYGYISQIVEDIIVQDSEIQVRDVTLIEAPTVTVTGIVTDIDTGFPIENATVEILDAPIEPVQTNSDGEYIIENVVEGTYNFRVTAFNYANYSAEIAVNSSSNIIDFVLFASIHESFETGNFNTYLWEFGGAEHWDIDGYYAYDGFYSAKSGNITHNRVSQILVTLETTFPCEISFFRKVSSEVGYDYLRFYINGVLQDEWSGERDWEQMFYFTPYGTNTFLWEYYKDNSVSNGDDAGWIDYIVFPPTSITNIENVQLLFSPELIGNYPNPFNPETTICFTLNTENTEIIIYNIKGQKVKTFNSFPNPDLSGGTSEVVWDGTDENNIPVGSGIYFYKLKVNDKIIAIKKCLLLK
ncbi:MAG: carboxypeptidase regulatory-like domain-containing protein [Armatimonadetes bacterium]|nr:carboxypeptidase regulatory-like domain-containing protein [Armatimonadota bacterium]